MVDEMAVWTWSAFEGGHAGSQAGEGFVGSGRRRPETGRVAQGRGVDSRPCKGDADMTGTLVDTDKPWEKAREEVS